jgi:hypothetical protein
MPADSINIFFNKNHYMKILSVFTFYAFIGVVIFASACQKEVLTSGLPNANELTLNNPAAKHIRQERPLNGDFLDSLNFVPDWAGGYNPLVDPGAPAWYPGTGKGNLSHMGLAHLYMNEKVLPTGPFTGAGPTSPVNDYFQSPLASYGLTVPDEVGWIFFDENGNSIWAKGDLDYSSPVDNLMHVNITGNLQIINGTGKFSGAKGHYNVKGYTDLKVPLLSPCYLQIHGIIVY